MSAPLAGVRVLDLTNVLAGPFCTAQLAHLGAEVIKIEAPGRGDLARNLGGDPELNARGAGVSFLAQNAGKASVTLDLKSAAGKELFLGLIDRADVVVENFRPGVMERLSLGAETLRARKPELIYAAISGYGQDGPWRDRPAYDQIIQGVSGAMSITGDPGPYRVGYPIADTIGGLTAAMAISAALNAEPRGCVIDVSMLTSVLATMGWVVSNWAIAGIDPAAQGNENPTSAPSGAFRASDGLINIAANKDEQWTLLARHLGREDLLDRPEYATREDRKRNRAALGAELEGALAVKPARVWARELSAIGVPAGAVMTVPEILKHPQVADRGFLARYDDPPGVGRPIETARPGFRIDGATPSRPEPPPALGQDNARILGELGVSAEDLERLAAEGVL